MSDELTYIYFFKAIYYALLLPYNLVGLRHSKIHSDDDFVDVLTSDYPTQ